MDAKDLIKNMLVIDPDKRYSIEKCIRHAWFGILEDEREYISEGVVTSLRNYRRGSKMRRAAMNIFVKLLKDSDRRMTDLRKEFDVIDQSKTGILTIKEMKTALQNCTVKLKGSEIKAIIRELDFDSNGLIHYSEFLAATLEPGSEVKEDKALAVFNQFDCDGEGRISADNVVTTLMKMGFKYSRAKAQGDIRLYDSTKTGELTFEDFLRMMRNEE